MTKEGQRKWDGPQVGFSVLPSPFEGESVLIFEQFPSDDIGEHPCMSQAEHDLSPPLLQNSWVTLQLSPLEVNKGGMPSGSLRNAASGVGDALIEEVGTDHLHPWREAIL